MSNILVVAPHPDDETLGCGGTLLKHKEEGHSIYWLVMTCIKQGKEYSEQQVKNQKDIISLISKEYPFDDYHQADFQSCYLDTIPIVQLIDEVSNFIRKIKPDIMYLPHPHDIHSDHGRVFDAGISCAKSFRYPYIKKVRIYETLSETEFSLNIDGKGFKPNLFIDVSSQLEEKINIMKLYEGEMGKHPFPRSEDNIRSLATLRGATAGCIFAESFMSIKEIL